MTDEITLDTHIAPPASEGEIDILLFALDRSRAQFAWKVSGLDAAALNRPHPPSTMTLGGLIKHLALVEDVRGTLALGGEAPPTPPWDNPRRLMEDDSWVWRSAAEDSPQYLYELYAGAVERTRAVIAKVLADGGLDQPVRFPGFGPMSVRRNLVDLHEEYARHVGHADLMREAIDGLVGEDPPR